MANNELLPGRYSQDPRRPDGGGTENILLRLQRYIIEEGLNPSEKNLVSKLIAAEKLNHFILSLQAGGEGYILSVSVWSPEASHFIKIDAQKLPYDEDRLLEYIDNEELPPMLVELIQSSPSLNRK